MPLMPSLHHHFRMLKTVTRTKCAFTFKLNSLRNSIGTTARFSIKNPISKIFKLLPPLDELSNFSSRSESQIQILQQIQPEFKLIENPRTDTQSIKDIAKSILERIQAFKPGLKNRFKQYIPLQLSILFGFLSFIICILLHLTDSHLLYKRSKRHPRFPFRIKREGLKIETKTVQVVAINDYEHLQEHPYYPLHKCSLVLPLEIKNHFENQTQQDSNKEQWTPTLSTVTTFDNCDKTKREV